MSAEHGRNISDGVVRAVTGFLNYFNPRNELIQAVRPTPPPERRRRYGGAAGAAFAASQGDGRHDGSTSYRHQRLPGCLYYEFIHTPGNIMFEHASPTPELKQQAAVAWEEFLEERGLTEAVKNDPDLPWRIKKDPTQTNAQ